MLITALSLGVMSCGMNTESEISSSDNGSTTKVSVSTQNANVVYASEDLSVDELFKDMGNGMSLGNDLDVCDWDAIGSNKAIDYQAHAIAHIFEEFIY